MNFHYAFDRTDSSDNSSCAYLAVSNSPETAISGSQFRTSSLIITRGSNDSFSISNPNPASTRYVVTFELIEDVPLLIDSDDVGAGFDNVVVNNAIAVPLKFSPGMNTLTLGA